MSSPSHALPPSSRDEQKLEVIAQIDRCLTVAPAGSHIGCTLLQSPLSRDEQNLEENERIKKELNPRKIGEPNLQFCRL